MRDTIEMAREAKMPFYWRSGEITYLERLKVFEALVRADERMGFYGQDKPTECAEGCPPNQICDYCQVVAPVKAMILAEREACAKVCDSWSLRDSLAAEMAEEIRARGQQ
jgi:hypothetical protein